MSYALVNPPPTAGPLPVVDSASLGVPYYAPASGGGGSAGPNLNVSTITMNPTGLINFPNAGNNNAVLQGFQDSGNTSSSVLSINFVSGYADKVNGQGGVWSVLNDLNGPNDRYGDFAAGRFAVLGNNSGTSVSVPVLDADQSGQLSINSVSTVNISSATLTWNGAPISGGGVNPAGISTAQVAGSAGSLSLVGPSQILMSSVNVNALGVTNFNLAAGNLNVSSINNAAVGIDAAGISTNQVASATNTKLNLYGGSTATYVTVDSVADSIVLAATQVDATNADLLVSSINGAAPGGGAIANLSVASVSSGFVIALGGAPVIPMTTSFATTVGHIYQLSWTDSIIVTGSGATPNSYIQYTLSTPSAFQGLDVIPGPPLEALGVSSITSHIANFNALDSSAQLVIAPTGMPSTLLTLNTGQDIILRDLGPVS